MKSRPPADLRLPGILATVADVCGVEVAAKLAGALGGTDIYIAETPRPSSQLARAVGLEAAQTIAKALGRGHYPIPLGVSSQPNRTPVGEIRRRLAAGERPSAIARTVGVTVKTVRNIRDGRTHKQLDIVDWLHQRGS